MLLLFLQEEVSFGLPAVGVDALRFMKQVGKNIMDVIDLDKAKINNF